MRLPIISTTRLAALLSTTLLVALTGCGGGGGGGGGGASSGGGSSGGQAVNTSHPDQVVGTGTAGSCTSAAVVAAVAQGGIITFNCGSAPVTIAMTATAKVFNNKPDVTLDGGGKVTLDGGNTVRILYQNTCDSAQVWTTPTCQNQPSPTLTVQNIAFTKGNSTGQTTDGGGGGAIFVRGGHFNIVNSTFTKNQCEGTGQDIGGGAVRVLSIYNGDPVYVTNSTFGGASGLGNFCSNGGALSSIGVSYTISNSTFTFNSAIGNGANPARAGTPGGGSGGAIYNDGNNYALRISGSTITDNSAVEGGGAVFYVSNDNSGTFSIASSTFIRNPNSGFFTAGYPGIFVQTGAGKFTTTGSSISP